jgi:hypothetical protein
MLSAAIWFAVVKPINGPGMVWGGAVYRSKQEFNLYLKSKGLSYATWLGRNPGVAPWEPGRRARKSDQKAEIWDWRRDMLLAINAAMLAIIAAVILARNVARPGKPKLAAPDVEPFSAVPTIRSTVARGVGYVELGAEQLTSTATNRIRRRFGRNEVTLLALAIALATILGTLVALLLN